MSEIAQYQNASGAVSPFGQQNQGQQVALSETTMNLMEWAQELDAAGRLAGVLCGTDFVPKGLRGNVEATAAAILTGREIGLSPMNALANIFIVQGRPSMYARTMVALVLSHGHELERTDATERAVTVRARRKGSQAWQTFTWSIDRAQKAGYLNNAKYKTDPIAMLTAKAQTEACRTMFADVLSGMAATSVEEIELDDAPPVEPAQSGATAEKKTTVKRKVTTRAKAPEPSVPDVSDTPAPEPVEETAEDTEPAGEEPGDAAVKSSRAQWTLAGQLMTELGIEDKADKATEMRSWAESQGITRELPSMAALSSEECSRFINYLEQLVNPSGGDNGAGEDDHQSWQAAEVPE